MPDQVTSFFISFNKFFPTIVVVGGLIGGNYLYKVKDQFKEDLIEEMEERFVTKNEVKEYTPDVMFDVFKTRTNSAISDVRSKADVHEATVNGVLDRVERDVSDIKEDLREYIRSNQ